MKDKETVVVVSTTNYPESHSEELPFKGAVLDTYNHKEGAVTCLVESVRTKRHYILFLHEIMTKEDIGKLHEVLLRQY